MRRRSSTSPARRRNESAAWERGACWKMVSPRAGRLLQRAAGGDLGVEDALPVFGAQTFAQRGAVVRVRPGHRDEQAEDAARRRRPSAAPSRSSRSGDASPSSASGCGGMGMTMALGRDQGVDADERKARRAIEHDQLVARARAVRAHAASVDSRPRTSASARSALARSIEPGRMSRFSVGGRSNRLVDREVVQQHAGGRRLQPAAADAAPDRCRGLAVEVDEQHAPAGGSERGGQVHRGRRLSDATLVVDDGNYNGQFFRHYIPNHVFAEACPVQWKCPQNLRQAAAPDTVNDRDPNSASVSVRGFRTAEPGGCGGMRWLGWVKRGANGGDPRVEQWRKDWEAACAAPVARAGRGAALTTERSRAGRRPLRDRARDARRPGRRG